MEEIYTQSIHFFRKLGRTSAAAYGVAYPKEDFMTYSSSMHSTPQMKSYLFCHTSDATAVMRPAGTYAVLYYQGLYEKNVGVYKRLTDFLNEQHLVLDGDVHEEYLLHALSTKAEEEYITKISVRVKSESV